MGTTLTGTTPQDTYDSLIKVTDNGPLSGTLKALSDGLGNDSSLSLSTTAASFSGTLAVTESVQVNNELVLTTNNAAFRIYRTTGINYFDWSSGQDLAFSTVTTAGGSGRAERMRLTSTGNVGIGQSAPTALLHLEKAAQDNILAVVGQDTYEGALFLSSAGSGKDANIVIGNSRSLIFYSTANSTPAARGTRILTIDSQGIKFGTDTAAANALDDYEEGTWTMGVSFGGASVDVTTSSNAGTYTKIGRQVTVNGYLVLTSKGSSTGAARITGLPFTLGGSGGNYGAASLYFDKITFTNQFSGYGVISTTTISLEESTILGVTSLITDADFANNSSIVLSLTYFV
jgi:hypothetical protein